MILLPQPSKCWDYGSVQLCPVLQFVFLIWFIHSFIQQHLLNVYILLDTILEAGDSALDIRRYNYKYIHVNL
jgi:hypothetical protein